ncbi:hypothetical protein O5190_27530, partial [Escherichia coli]|nr:hypothetical protein [Escherichia coli]
FLAFLPQINHFDSRTPSVRTLLQQALDITVNVADVFFYSWNILLRRLEFLFRPCRLPDRNNLRMCARYVVEGV